MKISFLDASTIGADIDLSLFNVFGDLKVYHTTTPDNFFDHVADSEIIITNKQKLGRHNLVNCPNVKLICVTATGYDNIDISYCREKGIAVCNVVGYSTQNVAQLTVAMALSLICHLNEYNRSVADGSYTAGGVANILTPVYHELYEKTWGIVGYGNIGKQVGAVARALGCKVLIYKKTPIASEECVDINTLCKNSDIISIHTPLNDETRNLINRDRISLMKKDAIVINVARGAVCDEKALAESVLNDRIGGVGIDVYSQEPFSADHPCSKIAGRDNVILTPHMAWGSYEARVRCCREVALNIESYMNGDNRNRIV